MDKRCIKIAGAGIAGLTAAINLAKAGVSVCLVEQDKLPKEKVCSGALRVTVIKRFPYLEPIVREITLSVIRKATFYSPKLHKVTASNGQDIAFLVHRYDFSNALLKLCREAGVKHFFGQRVRRIVREKEYIITFLSSGRQIRTKAIIGCDGINSLVARELGLNTRVSADYFALASEQELEFETGLPDDEALFYYGFQDRLGYGWVFSKGKLINVGVGFSNTAKGIGLKKAHQSFINFLKKQKVLPNNFPLEGIRAWVLPNGRLLNKTFGERVLICGDAAGFVHPIIGEGMYYALISGELAAKTIIQSVKLNDYSEDKLSQYQELWQKEFEPEFKDMVFLQKFLAKHLDIVDLAIKIFEKDTHSHQLFLDLIAGRISYRKFKSRIWPKILYLLAKTGRKKLLWPKS